MITKPMVFPLDETGTLYMLQDQYGREAGVGSRETCYTLLHLFFRQTPTAPPSYARAEPDYLPALAGECYSPQRMLIAS